MHTLHTIHTIHIQYYVQYIQSAGLPACLIGRCCSCFCSWLVLVPLFSCCAFLLRLNQGHPPPLPLLKHHSHATWLGPAWQLSWRPCLQLRAQPVRLAQVAIRPHCSKKLQFLGILLGIRDSWNKFRNAVPWHSMAAEASCSDRAHQELVFQLQQPSTMSWVASDQSLDRLSGQTKWPPLPVWKALHW